MNYDINPTLKQQIEERDPLAFTRTQNDGLSGPNEAFLGTPSNFESCIDELSKRAMQELEDRFRYELATNDWGRYPILDIVRGQEYGMRLSSLAPIESHAYESPAPKFSECDYPPDTHVWRVTRPLYDRLLQDHLELFLGEEAQ